MRFDAGDDVLVEFDGIEHAGEIVRHHNGWCVCTILVDMNADYGAITPRMAPHSTVCVPERHVRHAHKNDR